MNILKTVLSYAVFPLLALRALSADPIKADYAIFLFDNGEKNFVASMLKYAESHDLETLKTLDFRIVFMGASIDAMNQEPFNHYPDKLIHYKDLGIEETIDRNWIRNQRISETSLKNLASHLQIEEKAWLGVSCSVFGQIIQDLQNRHVEVLALRDNPNPEGDTDYFIVAKEVQSLANKIAVPSQDTLDSLPVDKQAVIVGHPPLEEYEAYASSLNKTEIIERLGLNPDKPIVVYAGVYGSFYEEAFKRFLSLLKSDDVISSDIQVLVVPHPRFKGAEEKKQVAGLDEPVKKKILIAVEFEEEKSSQIKTLEALAIADVVITADATSTIVVQSKALGKKVLYVNPSISQVSTSLCKKGVIQRVDSSEDLLSALQEELCVKDVANSQANRSIFEILGIPKEGARLLWESFTQQAIEK